MKKKIEKAKSDKNIKKDKDNSSQNDLKLDQILQTNKKILETNEKILQNCSYLKNYFRNRSIFLAAKWVLLLIILILGFISFSSIFDYLRDNINLYETRFNQVLEYKEFIDK